MAQSAQDKHIFDEIPYLLHHLSSVLDRQFAVALEEQLQVSVSQLRIIEALIEQPYSQQRSIARFLGQTQSAISRQIQILEDGGYVSRKQNPNDSRQRIITLRPSARTVSEKAHRLRRHCYQRILQDGLGVHEQELLRFNLQKLHKELCTTSAYGCDQHTR